MNYTFADTTLGYMKKIQFGFCNFPPFLGRQIALWPSSPMSYWARSVTRSCEEMRVKQEESVRSGASQEIWVTVMVDGNWHIHPFLHILAEKKIPEHKTFEDSHGNYISETVMVEIETDTFTRSPISYGYFCCHIKHFGNDIRNWLIATDTYLQFSICNSCPHFSNISSCLDPRLCELRNPPSVYWLFW